MINLTKRNTFGLLASAFISVLIPSPLIAKESNYELLKRKILKQTEEFAEKLIISLNFEYNDASTRKYIKETMEIHLKSIKEIVEYNVICDETNNSPNVIDNNDLVLDWYIKLDKNKPWLHVNAHAMQTAILNKK